MGRLPEAVEGSEAHRPQELVVPRVMHDELRARGERGFAAQVCSRLLPVAERTGQGSIVACQPALQDRGDSKHPGDCVTFNSNPLRDGQWEAPNGWRFVNYDCG